MSSPLVKWAMATCSSGDTLKYATTSLFTYSPLFEISIHTTSPPSMSQPFASPFGCYDVPACGPFGTASRPFGRATTITDTDRPVAPPWIRDGARSAEPPNEPAFPARASRSDPGRGLQRDRQRLFRLDPEEWSGPSKIWRAECSDGPNHRTTSGSAMRCLIAGRSRSLGDRRVTTAVAQQWLGNRKLHAAQDTG
jgi:hypothetical protein